MTLTDDMMYQASLAKDTAFEGIFFTAVKTTGIFCRPSCSARKPKKENVEFFSTVRECIAKGYRPCKVCKPMERLHETPPHIRQLIDELAENPALRFKDQDLVRRGMEPHQVRRWFLKTHGITFHAYQRMFRINTAFKKIQNGTSVTTTAFSSGYESLSGFGASFKKIFGVTPVDGKAKRVIDLKRMETPLGTMFACAVEEGICLLEFSDRRMLETQFKTLSKQLNATVVQGSNQHFDVLEKQLGEYFDGVRKNFDIPLFTPGSPFQKSVWEQLQSIPYGEVRSYQRQAALLGKPNAVRAVASANGMNRIAILIPCHRVIGADGSLVGYGGGVWRKQYLLDLEKKTT